MSLAEYNISTPVKRPWNHDTLTAHWSQINLKDALDPAPMRILDVGFGIHQRSTRALATLFPEAKLVAIDNDLRLLNSEKHQQQDGVCYRFGDVDCWLPSSDTEDLFDLIVVCLAAHAFSHPLRGIANLVDLISPNGHLLFVHRTDPVMRAICRLPLQHDNSEAKQIENVWGDLEKMARETQNEDSKWRPIPWRLRLVCEHEPLDYLCHCLGLSRIGSWSSDHSRLPDNQETIANVFGFNSGQPQYQAPFHARSGRWSLDKPEVLNSKIQLSSYLYKQSQTPLRVESLPHVFAPAQSIVPPRIAEINVQDAPLESGRFKQAVWNLLSDTLRGDLKDVPTSESLDDEILVRGAYLVGVDKEQSSRFWGPDQEVKDGDSNMITEAVASSNVLIPGRDRHSFLVL